MSKISLEPNASGAGTFTLAAPNSNTNRTLNLPDESGVLFSDGSGVPGSAVAGQLASSNMPAGSVIQTVSAGMSGTFSTSSTTPSTISDGVNPLEISLTPISSNSKILLFCSTSFSLTNSNGDSGHFRFYRNNTPISIGDASGGRTRAYYGSRATSDSSNGFIFTFNKLSVSMSTEDLPQTTSPVIYSVKAFIGSGGTMSVNKEQGDNDGSFSDRGFSSLIAMEIAG